MNLFSPGKRTGGKIDSYQTEHSCRKGGGMGQGKEKSAWCTTGKIEVKRSRMELCGYRGSQSRLLRLSLRGRDQAHPASSQGVLGTAPVWGRGHPLTWELHSPISLLFPEAITEFIAFSSVTLEFYLCAIHLNPSWSQLKRFCCSSVDWPFSSLWQCNSAVLLKTCCGE